MPVSLNPPPVITPPPPSVNVVLNSAVYSESQATPIRTPIPTAQTTPGVLYRNPDLVVDAGESATVSVESMVPMGPGIYVGPSPTPSSMVIYPIPDIALGYSSMNLQQLKALPRTSYITVPAKTRSKVYLIEEPEFTRSTAITRIDPETFFSQQGAAYVAAYYTPQQFASYVQSNYSPANAENLLGYYDRMTATTNAVGQFVTFSAALPLGGSGALAANILRNLAWSAAGTGISEGINYILTRSSLTPSQLVANFAANELFLGSYSAAAGFIGSMVAKGIISSGSQLIPLLKGLSGSALGGSISFISSGGSIESAEIGAAFGGTPALGILKGPLASMKDFFAPEDLRVSAENNFFKGLGDADRAWIIKETSAAQPQLFSSEFKTNIAENPTANAAGLSKLYTDLEGHSLDFGLSEFEDLHPAFSKPSIVVRDIAEENSIINADKVLEDEPTHPLMKSNPKSLASLYEVFERANKAMASDLQIRSLPSDFEPPAEIKAEGFNFDAIDRQVDAATARYFPQAASLEESPFSNLPRAERGGSTAQSMVESIDRQLSDIIDDKASLKVITNDLDKAELDLLSRPSNMNAPLTSSAQQNANLELVDRINQINNEWGDLRYGISTNKSSAGLIASAFPGIIPDSYAIESRPFPVIPKITAQQSLKNLMNGNGMDPKLINNINSSNSSRGNGKSGISLSSEKLTIAFIPSSKSASASLLDVGIAQKVGVSTDTGQGTAISSLVNVDVNQTVIAAVDALSGVRIANAATISPDLFFPFFKAQAPKKPGKKQGALDISHYQNPFTLGLLTPSGKAGKVIRAAELEDLMEEF